MLVLYHLALVLLGGVTLALQRRAAALERKFARLAKDVHGLLRDPILKEGNSGKQDPYQVAKRQYLLGALVQKKDRLEARHYAWASKADRMAALVAWLRGWKGRLVPYAFGVLDVLAVICLVEYWTEGDLAGLWQLVSAL
jgi:hypothetical protein